MSTKAVWAAEKSSAEEAAEEMVARRANWGVAQEFGRGAGRPHKRC